MLFEQTVRLVCSQDPLEEAQSRRQMKVASKVMAERKARVNSALAYGARSIPTEGHSNPAGHRVQA